MLYFVDQMACEKLLDVVSGLVPPNQELTKAPEDLSRIKSKTRKGKHYSFIHIFCLLVGSNLNFYWSLGHRFIGGIFLTENNTSF